MGLDDPNKKMSKSEAGSNHAISLIDPPDVIRNKVKRATTDSLKDIVYDEARPGLYNLLVIYELFSGQSREEIVNHFAGKGYGDLKKELAEVVIEGLAPVRNKYAELTAEPGYLDTLMAEGAAKARPIAEKTLKRVQEKVGLG
jgi:tryptophanyl-tRNA synthetase